MKKQILRHYNAFLAFIFSCLTSIGVAAESGLWNLNMPRGVTEVSKSAYDVHMLMMYVCIAIGVVVFGFMFYVMYAHRKSRGVKAANFHENFTVEVIWTIVPAIILLGMAFPATTSLLKVYDTENPYIDIKVTGYQWKWQYEYIGEGIKFMSELRTSQDEQYGRAAKGEHYLREVTQPLVIPANKKVRFLITGNDVIHSWWVPDFAVKRDAIPGLFTSAWAKTDQPGVYVGACTELCGKDHSRMPVVVEVKEEADYYEWLAGKKAEAVLYESTIGKNWSDSELMAKGEEIYGISCAGCHQAQGEGIAGIFPSLVGSSIVTGPVEDHIGILINGVSGSAMQSFADQLSEVDIAAVIHYKRNSWGNNMNDTVQPLDILNYKQSR